MYHVTCLSKTEDTFLRLVNNSLSYCQIVDFQKVLFLVGSGLGGQRCLVLAIEIVIYLGLWMNTCAVQQGVKKYHSFSVVFARKRSVNRLTFLLSLTWNPDESSTYTPSLARHSKEHNDNNSSELSCDIFVFISLIATPILSTYQKDFNSQDVDPPKSNKHKFTSTLRKSMIVTSKSRKSVS